ncbi:MAG: (2Fe-2S)-binding protein [Actinobacteria bacterium]|nr:(2Fe-2S)-binding protein [Actinomycetota bacterium]
MGKISVVVDGRTFQAEKDTCILEVARRNGIHIPSLCYNSEVTSSGGSCRVCLVEAHQGER